MWKLARVIDGLAPPRLLDTCSHERVYAAAENIMNSTRSTDFITPASNASGTFRDAVLQLAEKHPFAPKRVNLGRRACAQRWRVPPQRLRGRSACRSSSTPTSASRDVAITATARAGDDLYQMLIDGHRGLSNAQSTMLNARPILLLANHVGDLTVLCEARALAREGVAHHRA